MNVLKIDINHEKIIYKSEVKNNDEIRDFLGGYFEIAYTYDNGDLLLVDEEGLYKESRQITFTIVDKSWIGQTLYDGRNVNKGSIMAFTGKAVIVGGHDESFSDCQTTVNNCLATAIDRGYYPLIKDRIIN